MAEWFFKNKGKVVGPVSNAELAEKVRKGVVTVETPVSKNNSKWVRAAAVDGLFREEETGNVYVCPYCGESVAPAPTTCTECKRTLSTVLDSRTLHSPKRDASGGGRSMFGWLGGLFKKS